MKKIKSPMKLKKLTLGTSTVRVLTTNDLQDVVGGTSVRCTQDPCYTYPCAETNYACP